MNSSTKPNDHSSDHRGEPMASEKQIVATGAECVLAGRPPTLEDRALKFIERNNRGIWIGILAVCAVTVLVTERG